MKQRIIHVKLNIADGWLQKKMKSSFIYRFNVFTKPVFHRFKFSLSLILKMSAEGPEIDLYENLDEEFRQVHILHYLSIKFQ